MEVVRLARGVEEAAQPPAAEELEQYAPGMEKLVVKVFLDAEVVRPREMLHPRAPCFLPLVWPRSRHRVVLPRAGERGDS